jgi:amylosucrase
MFRQGQFNIHADQIHSRAAGALFSVNEKTGDARISGTLASLCGLEYAQEKKEITEINKAIDKILLMQAHSFLLGGIPMLFYGDEAAYCNDYSYLQDDGKNYDNRWMHRPIINWEKNKKIKQPGSVEEQVFTGTRKLLSIRKKLPVLADKKNLTWLTPHNTHVAGFLRAWDADRVYCLFNFSNETQMLTWYAFKEHGMKLGKLFDHWSQKEFDIMHDHEYLVLPPYSFFVLEPV